MLVTKRVTLSSKLISFIACHLDRELSQFMIDPNQELEPLFASPYTQQNWVQLFVQSICMIGTFDLVKTWQWPGPFHHVQCWNGLRLVWGSLFGL